MSEKKYIDVGEALFELETGLFPQDVVYTEAVSIAKEIIQAAPTADVVPKSEVAREIFEEIESMLIRYTFEDGYGEYISTGLADEFAELKKKYTEDQSDGL